MDIRWQKAAFTAIVAVCSACGSTTNGGGGGVYIAKDASGDGVIADGKSSDATVSDVKGSDVKPSDTKTSDSGADGGVTPEQMQQCWQDHCASQMSACQNSATCASFMACVFACPKTDSVCPNKCADPLKNDMTAFGAFTTLANCSKANCNLSTLPANTCGNGKCEGDENTWCSMDCDTTIGPLADCTTGKCSADACILDSGCNKALNCVLECTDPSCWSGCTPTGASAGLYQPVWDCVQVDCSVYLPSGSP